MEEELSKKKCVPCEGTMPPMSPAETNQYLSKIMDWELIENKSIKKEFKFKNFKESLDFVNKVGALAEEEKHHPNITIIYNKVRISLSTHAIGGLSENDFIMAAKIDLIKGQIKTQLTEQSERNPSINSGLRPEHSRRT